jgi:hypothetical protein
MNVTAFKTLAAAAALKFAATGALADGGPDAYSVFRMHKAAINRGDVGAAMGHLTDDVHYVAGPNCTAAKPCIGAAAVQKGFVEMAIDRKMLIVLDAAPLPRLLDTYRLRAEVRWPGIERIAGAQRIVGVDAFTLRDDRIATVAFSPDMDDAQTAAHFKAVAASAVQKRALGQHPAVLVHARPQGIDPNHFIVQPPASVTWTLGPSAELPTPLPRSTAQR